MSQVRRLNENSNRRYQFYDRRIKNLLRKIHTDSREKPTKNNPDVSFFFWNSRQRWQILVMVIKYIILKFDKTLCVSCSCAAPWRSRWETWWAAPWSISSASTHEPQICSPSFSGSRSAARTTGRARREGVSMHELITHGELILLDMPWEYREKCPETASNSNSNEQVE